MLRPCHLQSALKGRRREQGSVKLYRKKQFITRKMDVRNRLLWTSSCRRPAPEHILQKLVRVDLHGSAVQHVEHVRVGGAASVAVIAHEVVDAHSWPAAGL